MKSNFILKSLQAILCLIVLGLTGCSIGPAVQPWEKETLARPEMTFEGDPLDSKYGFCRPCWKKRFGSAFPPEAACFRGARRNVPGPWWCSAPVHRC